MFIIMIFMMLGGAFCAIDSSNLDALGGTEPTSGVQLKSVHFFADQDEGGKVSLPDAGQELQAKEDLEPGCQRAGYKPCCYRWGEIAEEQTCKGAMMRWFCLPQTSKKEKFKAAFLVTSICVGVLTLVAIFFAAAFGFGSSSSDTSA